MSACSFSIHTQAEYGAYLRDSSRVPLRRPFIYIKPPYAIASVPSLSGHATAYRWRSLPRVRRHRASKPRGSSERVLPWQVTMDQVACAFLSHTHYWYEVGMLKVPPMYTYIINRHAGTPEKQQKQKQCSTSSNMVVVILYCYIGCKDKATTWYLTGFPEGSNLGSTV